MKLSFCKAKHILSLDGRALAKEIFCSQLKCEFPGLAKEVKNMINNYELPDITNEDVNRKWSKARWKKIVKAVLKVECKLDLIERIKEKSKLTESKMKNEEFQTKQYLREMKIEDARTKFKLRTKMIEAKFNFKNDPIHRLNLWRCDSCQSAIDTQNHILWCPSYAELREGKDIKNDADLIEYVKQVMKIRDELKIIK